MEATNINGQKQVTLSYEDIAEYLVASYKFNNEHDHLEHCSAIKVLINDEKTYQEICEIAKAKMNK